MFCKINKKHCYRKNALESRSVWIPVAHFGLRPARRTTKTTKSFSQKLSHGPVILCEVHLCESSIRCTQYTHILKALYNWSRIAAKKEIRKRIYKKVQMFHPSQVILQYDTCDISKGKRENELCFTKCDTVLLLSRWSAFFPASDDSKFKRCSEPDCIQQYKAGIILLPDTVAVVGWDVTAMDGALVGLGASSGKGRDVADFSAELPFPGFGTPFRSAPVAAAL